MSSVTEWAARDEYPPRFDGEHVLAKAAELLAGFESSSVTTLLHAACSSPTARQAMASCSALLMSCWAAPPSGSKIASCEDLAVLVEMLRGACPELASVEDFLPLDPRENVHFRAVSERGTWEFRVHPGGLESPLQTLQAALNYAEAVDPILVPRAGFGLIDMFDLTSQMLAAELSLLAPTWSSQRVGMDSPPTVTEAEVIAAASHLQRWRECDELPAEFVAAGGEREDDQLVRAARILTVESQDLKFDAGPDRAPIGPVLIVRSRSGLLPVPSALIIESLTAAIGCALRLLRPASEIVGGGPDSCDALGDGESAGASSITESEAAEAARRWRHRADADLQFTCRALPATIMFGYYAEDGHELLLVAPSHRHVVAVELVTALTNQEITERITAARARLTGFGPGSPFRIALPRDNSARAGRTSAASPPPDTTDPSIAWLAGTADAIPFAESLMTGQAAQLAAGTIVTRVVVVDGPWQHGPQWIPEIPACTLREFRTLLSTQDWQSTDREELWSFLDELTDLGTDANGNGYAGLFCWSILDAWEAWQVAGMLCPAWVQPDTGGHILPRDLDIGWERDALLDPVDALLARFGMPPAREWPQLISTQVPAATPGLEAQSFIVALTLYEPRRIWWVAADMNLLVTADLEFHGDLIFSRASVGTLANTIEDTLREVARRNTEAWQLWRRAHGGRPVAIRVTPARLPGHMPELRFVGMETDVDEIFIDPERLAKLAPEEMHALIGEALTFAILARLPLDPHSSNLDPNPDQRDAHPNEGASPLSDEPHDQGTGTVLELNPSTENIRDAEMFKTAWQSIPPRLTQGTVTTPFAPHVLTAAQTLTQGGQQRASRRLARRLRNHIDPGTHPLTAVLDIVCPEAMQTLSDTAAGYAPRAALAAACAELERALSDRFASSISLELHLGSPWADETLAELDVGDSSDETRRSRVAELLVERLLSQQPSGTLVPDRRDMHQLLDLACVALEASLDAQYTFAAIRPAELGVSEYGDFEIKPTGPARADIPAWQRARLDSQARSFTGRRNESLDPLETDTAPVPNDPPVDEVTQRGSLRSILEEDARGDAGFRALNAGGLLAVDDQLIEHCGFGLDSVRAVLATVVSWDVPGEPYPTIAQVSRNALVDEVTSWSGLARQQIDAAITQCTLTATRIQEEGLRYWQLRERSARLALRPLIEPPGCNPDDLWLLPRCAHRTQQLLLTYLNDQQLPWPDRELPAPVQKAVRAWHKLAENQLERELVAAAGSAGLACRANLKTHKAALQGLTLRGEIDLLVADSQRRRIWVIEAKHFRQAFSPLEIGSRIADFDGPDALATGPDTHQFRQFLSRTFTPYIHRVLLNARAVEQNKQAAVNLVHAASLGSNFSEKSVHDWDVVALIVTSHVDIPAFVKNPGVSFVVVDNLRELLTVQQRPLLGLWVPKAN